MGHHDSHDNHQELKSDPLYSLGELPRTLGHSAVSGRLHGRASGRRIADSYELLEEALGSGLHGAVTLARAKVPSSTGRNRFAVKTLKLANLSEDKAASIMREAEIFLAVDHPHICRLFDVFETPEHVHLVMECLDGGELYDRMLEMKKFSEDKAAAATWQMLLALRYLHAHHIVHRDLKLDNFMYDTEGSDFLKLIDFGFSRRWNAKSDEKMQHGCGTLAYTAPEVLKRSYTIQCDMWSLGVIVFTMLCGSAPFGSGTQHEQMSKIVAGKYRMKPDKWKHLSDDAVDFTLSLLRVDPHERLTARKAIAHPWLAFRDSSQPRLQADSSIVQALRAFGEMSKFRRCCLGLLAWALTAEDRAKVRDYFIAIDANHCGTITFKELQKVLTDKFKVADEETRRIFDCMKTGGREDVSYSDFLAATATSHVGLRDDLLYSVFGKFDSDRSGCITAEDLRAVLGDSFEGDDASTLLAQADMLKNKRISSDEFVAFLRETPLNISEDASDEASKTDRDAADGFVGNELWRSKSSKAADAAEGGSSPSGTRLPPLKMQPARMASTVVVGTLAPDCQGLHKKDSQHPTGRWPEAEHRLRDVERLHDGFRSLPSLAPNKWEKPTSVWMDDAEPRPRSKWGVPTLPFVRQAGCMTPSTSSAPSSRGCLSR
eukprot:TRINITY_DN39621_c0_g1_i1.p1 TRINITY_DN39621_c0_g1~~TRINITY_DN39621_c0_g1_i1.p1  ORF type:complete len:659 (-),score=136.24 TRINITY_DN39621_c0_g1_i1:213-2189(-)